MCQLLRRWHAIAKAIAMAGLRRAEPGEKPITMNALAVQAGVAATTVTRLARTDEKAASALSLGLVSRIVMTRSGAVALVQGKSLTLLACLLDAMEFCGEDLAALAWRPRFQEGFLGDPIPCHACPCCPAGAS